MAETKKVDPFAMSSGAPEIQGEIRPKPKFADRISQKIIWVAVGVFGVLLGLFLMAFNAMDAKETKAGPTQEEAAKHKEAPVEKGTPNELKDEPIDGRPTSPSLVGAASRGEDPLTTGEAKPGNGAVPGSGTPAAPSKSGGVPPMGAAGNGGGLGLGPNSGAMGMGRRGDSYDGSGAPPQLTPAQLAAKDAEDKRRLRMAQARSDGLSVKAFTSGSGGGEATPGSTASNALNNLLTAVQQNSAAGNGGASMMATGMPQNTRGDAEQDEKLDFLKNASKEDRGYHQHVPLPPISPNEVKFGTYLPMQLEQGMNSDLPGEVTARITEDVYDTVTGCRLLIPANSKVMGKYDSKVAVGQNRALVVWTRMYDREGAELNMAGMQAYDTSGSAGMDAEVDNHYMRLFGLAFGMSMVTAAVQISVPPSNGGNNTQTVEQTVATALAQQYGQLGAQILGKYMAVQPTLRNYPGERFTIMVPRTMVFKKVWRNRCAGTGAKANS